ncbi:MAG: hypothetical protein HY866_18270 [Chloroflexi bacterium]|nr:hypothetical protein [Chloroflexota bacterium]
MRDFDFWQRWLVSISLLIVVFGVMMAVLGGTAAFDIIDNQINTVYWDVEGLDSDTEEFQQWVYGVMGATMAGWGVMMSLVARVPFQRKERWAWRATAYSVGLWFLIDSYVSLSTANYFNELAVNVPLLVLIVLPLWFTRHEFK